jgi:hypothetical protein
MVEKGVHFFGLCRLIRKDSLSIGIATRNKNSEDHYTFFGSNSYVCMFYFRSECLCISSFGWISYVY